MKKSKKIIASALALASVVSIASCGQSGGGRSTDTTPAATTTTTTAAATFETNDTDVRVQEAAENVELDKEIKVEKKIKWLAWYPIDETSGTIELFKANYGIPEEGVESYGDAANNIFVHTNVVYADRYDKLGQMIAAGDPPDIFPFEIRYFPISAIRSMFQPIDGVVDTYSEEWADTRDVMDKFIWGGKNYCAIPSVGLATPLWYRRSVVQEAGLEDPYELLMKGEWTWDKFREMMDTFQQSGDSRYGIDGWYTSEGFICSTGTPAISIVDGKLVNNLNTPALERAMGMVEELTSQEWIYPKETNGWQINPTAWINGDTLFMDDGKWFYEETIQKWMRKNEWPENDTMVVPFPRDPQADKYYVEGKQDAIMWVSGSTNEAGFKAYQNCIIASSKDPAVTAAQREKSKRDKYWTDELLDVIDYYEKEADFEWVFDFKNGISSRMFADDSPIEKIIKYPQNSPDNKYTTLRAENIGTIDADIAEANKTVS